MQLHDSDTGSSAHAAYWRARLAGLGEKSCFPADLLPGLGSAPTEAVHRVCLSVELTQRLLRISHHRPDALHVVLAAALVALLGRYTRQDDVVIGAPTPSAGAPGAGPGLVLRIEANGSFRELLNRLGVAVREAVGHQEFPIASLAEELGRTATTGENPYFDVAIELRGPHDPAPYEPDLAAAGVRMLFVAAAPTGSTGSGGFGEGLTLELRYDGGRFAASSVARIAQQYELLLDRATANPDRPLHEIDLYGAADEEIIAASNATKRDFDAGASIHGLFEAQVARNPQAPAVLIGEDTLSYADLDRRANQLAHMLRERGVGPDQVVAVLAERSAELLVAILAILKAGGAYLPIDPSFPQPRLDYLLADSGATLAVAQAEFVALAAAVPVLDLADPASYAARTDPVSPLGDSSNLAYVIYTSGSTGNPKGVQVEHHSVINRLAWMQHAYPIGAGDVVLQKTSISFDVSVWELFWWSFTGATLALLEPGGEKDPAVIISAVRRYQVSTIHFVPSMLRMLLGYVDRFGTDGDLDSLRQVFSSGEALTVAQASRFRELVGGSVLVNLYGPTEATVDVTHQRCAEPTNQARVPIGRPIDNVRMYVLDESGRPNPVGIPGELHVAGIGLARGYLHREELTRKAFIDGALVGEDRLYRTGDLARWLADGTLDYLGRMDLQVKVRGFRVEPGEIEQRLRLHEQVRDAAVICHDDGWQASLRCFVVLRSQVSEGELKQFLSEHLPEYMVPSRITAIEALPLTANGKLDRAALQRRDAMVKQVPKHVEPSNEREAILLAIWREVLGVAKLGVHDNFFALGGNSIHFVAVLAKSRAAGLNFTFQQLFAHQTIATLAGRVTEEFGAGSAPADATSSGDVAPFALLTPTDRAKIPEGIEDAYPLSMLQAGLIFQTEVTGGLGQYHDVLSYLIRGAFHPEAFEAAVRLLVRRNPILRTSYHLTGFSEFIQLVHQDVALPLHVVDLRGCDVPARDHWHERWLVAEKARRFGWSDGQMVTLHVQILADDLYRYTVSQHNSALDGWSISLLHTQLFELYHQMLERGRPEPPDVDNHLRNFIGLEREALASSLAREFWRRVLDGWQPTTLPSRAAVRDVAGGDQRTDFAGGDQRGAVAGGDQRTDFAVVMHDVPLPAGLTERLVALADSLSVPVKNVLLAAHVKVLSVLTGQRSVLTGYEHSGRPELAGAEAALGLFLNTLPFRVNLVDGSWAALINQIYQTELDLLPYRRYPMARMKQDLGTQRALFETTFNFTHFYLMKQLRELPEFALVDMRVDSETEFVFRTEFSKHFFDDDVRLCLHYHDHLFGPEYIEEIGGCFIRVLERMTSEPTAQHTGHDPWLSTPDGGANVPGRPRGGALAAAVAGSAAAVESGAAVEAMTAVEATTTVESAAAVGRIAAVWARVLGVPIVEINGDADFFALGGNSLSALRVVLELDGLVSLTDLTRHPRLARLGQLAVARRQPDEDVLHLLSGGAGEFSCAVVCVPYPCGHPINFKPLAEAVSTRTNALAVYGVAQPGHDPSRPGTLVGVVETAQRVVAEIKHKADLPLILWGHCGGAAITIEVARQLEDQGSDLRHVFIGSKLLAPVADMVESIEIIDGWTDRQVIRYLVDETGYAELDGLTEIQIAFMSAMFRHDVCDGYRYLIDLCQRPGRQLTTPLTVVAAADDRVMADAGEQFRRWGILARDVALHRLPGGGHYFVRTDPAEAGELIQRTWLSASEMQA